jgi:hypothetical protein
MSDTTFTWAIANLERHVDDGVVFAVHWTVAATDGQGSASAYGSLGLEPPNADMIPFDELTEDVVVAWVQHKLTGEQVATIEAALQAQLDEQQSPTRASGLPWQQALT